MKLPNKTGFRVWLILISICFFTLLLNPSCLGDTITGTISGRVVDELTGEGVEGVITTLNIEDWQSTTDKDGYFEFKEVPVDNDYDIKVFIDKEPYCTRIHELTINMEGRKEFIIEDIIAERGGAVEGSLKWMDGSPVLSMRVYVYTEGEIPGVYGAVPDKNGYYRVSKLPPGKDLNVVAACWDASKGCGRIIKEGIRVEKDKTTRGVDFAVHDNPPIIHGKIASLEGKPLQAHLHFWKESEDMGHLICDSSGNYSMSALEPGSYRIHVGYGDRKHKISEDTKLDLKKDDRIRMDITISEENIQFKTQPEKPDRSLVDVLEVEEEAVVPLTELIFSISSGYTEELKDRILDAYENDVRIKAASDCLPENVRMKIVNRLSDLSQPLYILIRDIEEHRKVSMNGRFKRVIQCGGTPRGSDYVFLYPVAFSDSCGSLASIMFHELLHIVGFGHDVVYSYTKQCYGKEAVDPPRDYRD